MLRFAASIFNNLRITLRSIIGAGIDGFLGHDHDYEWYEVWANQLSHNYFENRGYDLSDNWDTKDTNYPRRQHANWFFYSTLAYYLGFVAAAVFYI